MSARVWVTSAVLGGALLAGMQRVGAVPVSDNGPAPASAIAYAEAQLGKPYQWGGTGPGSFDCSGLVMEAYQAAGITLPRTSQEMWATGARVSTPRRGDLVFFAGADGTDDDPGHVGLVLRAHLMIDAYASGTTVRIESYGLPSSAPGLTSVVGFTDPAQGS